MSNLIQAILAKLRDLAPGLIVEVRVRVMGQNEKSAGVEAAPVDREGESTSDMLVEGGEAVDLYARQITFNVTELEKQVEMLRAACLRTGKLLREVE